MKLRTGFIEDEGTHNENDGFGHGFGHNKNDGFGRFTEMLLCIDGIAWRFGHSTYPLARISARKFVQDPREGGVVLSCV